MKVKRFESIVEEKYSGERIDKVLPLVFTMLTRAKGQHLIDSKNVLVDGESVKSSYKLKLNQKIELIIEEDSGSELTPQNIKLDVVYEDDDLIVINKPIDLVVHPAAGHKDLTLVNALLYHFDKLSSVNGNYRPGIVHRIDKDTTGLLVVAKNDAAHNNLALQIKDKDANRLYYALVEGEIDDAHFIIEAPIGRSNKNRKKMAVVSAGKDAKTEFKIVKRFSGYTLLQAKLYTGRTHQIRVHLAYINHPIIGDQLYGKKNKFNIKHQMLHAYQLELIHPTTGKKVVFNAELPEDFKDLIKQIERP
jgi:23S rRNA pseudouridine1911/1915/1917 synthase